MKEPRYEKLVSDTYDPVQASKIQRIDVSHSGNFDSLKPRLILL